MCYRGEILLKNGQKSQILNNSMFNSVTGYIEYRKDKQSYDLKYEAAPFVKQGNQNLNNLRETLFSADCNDFENQLFNSSIGRLYQSNLPTVLNEVFGSVGDNILNLLQNDNDDTIHNEYPNILYLPQDRLY